MAQVLPANVRPVVWLKRRNTKAGHFYRHGVKSSEVRVVKPLPAELAALSIAILDQEFRNAKLKARFAR